MRTCLLTLLLAFACAPVLAQEAASLDELWRVGSLWQVGDNRDRVDEARQAIVEAGDAGLAFTISKLDVNDTLQIRCLRAVIKGFGEAAVSPLVENISHEDANARRNVAELLADFDVATVATAADALLARARGEASMGARLAQLAALSKWGVEDAIPLIIEVSASNTERIRHRATSLLGAYATPEAVQRLVEMLDDDIFYVRAGASDALAKGVASTRATGLIFLRDELVKPVAEQSIRRIRLLLPVAATVATEDAGGTLRSALRHELGAVRGDAADALVTWRMNSGAGGLDVRGVLREAIASEHDPYARTAVEGALERLMKVEVK